MRSNRANDFPQRRKRPPVDETEEFFEEPPPPPRGGVPSDDGNPLWTIYSINPGLPLRIKIERLILMHDLDFEEVLEALQADTSNPVDAPHIRDLYDRMHIEWKNLGESLDPEERQIARGKMIQELRRIKADLESLGPDQQDLKTIQLKVSIQEKIAKLRGIENEKKPASETVNEDPVEAAMSKLSPQAMKELLEKLAGA